MAKKTVRRLASAVLALLFSAALSSIAYAEALPSGSGQGAPSADEIHAARALFDQCRNLEMTGRASAFKLCLARYNGVFGDVSPRVRATVGEYPISIKPVRKRPKAIRISRNETAMSRCKPSCSPVFQVY